MSARRPQQATPEATQKNTTAIGVAVLRILAALLGHLPLRPQTCLGRLLGRAALYLAPRRRRIADRNLALCFPAASRAQRQRLLVRNFEAAGLALLHSAMAWTRDPRTLAGRLDVIGEHRLRTALAAPTGLLLLGCHFMTLELCGAFLGLLADVDVVHRTGHNTALDLLRRRGRQLHFGALLDRADLRTLVRRLRAGRCVWYAFDQDPGPGQGVFAPFFGVPAATVDAAPRLAALTGAHLLFVDHWFDTHSLRWTLRFTPVPAAVPSGNSERDMADLNQLIEKAVLAHPEQYLWMHRRFKTRPPGLPDPYR